MATARKPAASKPALSVVKAPAAARVDPAVAADAAIGRRVREFFGWVTLLVSWVVSGWLTVVFYTTFPGGGLLGALATNAATGLLFILLILRWSQG